MRRYVFLFLAFGLILSPSAWCQSKKDLEKLRREIQKYRVHLEEKAKEELSLLDRLSRTEKEIHLTRQLINQLRQEELRKREQILKINKDLSKLTEEAQKLKERYKRRLIHYYKYGRLKNLELLLATRSIHQVYVWLKYRRRIAEADRIRLRALKNRKEAIEKKQAALRAELEKKHRILEEKQREEAYLEKKLRERRQLLKKIKRDKALYQQKIAEYQKAAQEIQRLIEARERERLAALAKRARASRERVSTFSRLKGKMIWPADGKIIAHFGPQKNPKFNTVIQNLGIDIKAPFGADVRATADGVVTAITWQRGRGNIIIINHFGGYYTVYTHLSEILVSMGEKVSEGQVIGRIGDSGSLKGPMLHFEIWKGTQNINPEKWLRKKG